MELIEPTVKRCFEDHETVFTLNKGYEALKKKVDDFEFTTTKQINRTVTLEDLARRLAE